MQVPHLTLFNFNKILTVTCQHHVVVPPKILLQSEQIKMPKLILKVEK